VKVKDIMSSHPATCTPTDHLGTAVWRMFQADCGFLPVTCGAEVVGVITDRDVAVSLMLRGRRPEDVMVGEVMQGTDGLIACEANDPPRLVMDRMRDYKLHRLPVLENGVLVGVVSLNDLAIEAGANGTGRPTLRDVALTLQGICAHRVEAKAIEGKAIEAKAVAAA
jgi:CBS domain-containing protein